MPGSRISRVTCTATVTASAPRPGACLISGIPWPPPRGYISGRAGQKRPGGKDRGRSPHRGIRQARSDENQLLGVHNFRTPTIFKLIDLAQETPGIFAIKISHQSHHFTARFKQMRYPLEGSTGRCNTKTPETNSRSCHHQTVPCTPKAVSCFKHACETSNLQLNY